MLYRTMKPHRVQLKRTKGWRLPPNTVVVARPSKWGNTYKVTKHRSAARAVQSFEYSLKWVLQMCNTGVGFRPTPLGRYFFIMAAALHELKGKNLACWCKPGQPCHADVLLEIANT